MWALNNFTTFGFITQNASRPGPPPPWRLAWLWKAWSIFSDRLGHPDLSAHRQPSTPTLSYSSPVLITLRTSPQMNRVYNPMNLTEAPAQKSGHALQWSTVDPHWRSLLADKKKWHCWPACMLRQESFLGLQRQSVLETDPWQLSLPMPSSTTELISLISVKNYRGYLGLKSFIGNHIDSQVAVWPTDQLLVLNSSIHPCEVFTESNRTPPDFRLLQEKDLSLFNCFPGSCRFNLT